MCGIACVFNAQQPELKLKKMLETISYRGDGNNEVWSGELMGLGSRRLAIVGRDSGRQPIWTANQSAVIVLNGEIYNWRELRQELSALGQSFVTESDTEVALHFFERFGIPGLNRIEGMFSFVIWKRESDSFIAVRDRFGVKPLFYAKEGETWFIASEAKALICVTGSQIRELGPGQYLTPAGAGNWYSIPMKTECSDYDHLRGKVRELVSDAVQRRLRTDLPVVVFLSGGIDSSIVLAVAKQCHDQVHAITTGMIGSTDIKAAVEVCMHLGVGLTIVPTTLEQLLESIEPVIFHTESFEQNMVRAGVFSYLLARKARQLGYKIALCGEGADEIFAGYGDFIDPREPNEFLQMTMEFVRDLHRTQLQRVDRLGMAYTVEVREPFLDTQVVECAVNLPRQFKIRANPYGTLTTKYILRDAFRDLLPEEIVWREKITLMQGAGLGHVNSSRNLFFEYAEATVDDELLRRMTSQFGEQNVHTREEALYCSIYQKFFGKTPLLLRGRPRTAIVELNVNR